MIQRIGIIGGTGQMGRMFQVAWEALGLQVMVTDHTTIHKEKDLVQNSDLVILSVPLTEGVNVLHRIQGWLREGQLLSEFSSVKNKIIPEMLDLPCDVIPCHPMFGQMPEIAGQKVIILPVNPGKQLQKFKRLFESLHLNVIVMEDWKKHDPSMSFIQGLMHFIHITFSQTLAHRDVDLETILSICSPVYRAHFAFACRILQRDPYLYTHILMDNEENKHLLQDFIHEAQESLKRIQKKDEAGFVENFLATREFLGHWGPTFDEESQFLIDQLREYQEQKGQQEPKNTKS